MPYFARSFITDWIETSIAFLVALSVAVPQTQDEAHRLLTVIGTGVLSALISAARRAAPAFILWVRAKLGTAG